MAPRNCLLMLCALLAALHLAMPSQLGRSAEDNTALARMVRAKFRSKLAADRLWAAERLSELSAAEGAPLAIHQGLVDANPAVRRHAYRALLGWSNEPQVCRLLEKTVEQATSRGGGDWASLAPVLAVLLASELPETQQRLANYIRRRMEAVRFGPPEIMAVIDLLAQEGDRLALASLEKLLRQDCILERFATRRAAVLAVTRVRHVEAGDCLLGLFGRLDGEVRADVVRYFTLLSGERYGDDLAAWQAWWREHRRGLAEKFPHWGAERGAEFLTPGAVSYYGLPLLAKRVVFVLDISGSMQGERLAAAKRELSNTISRLPADRQFGLVVYNHRVNVWRRELAPATAAAKQEAMQYVGYLRAVGSTATYDALEAALSFDVEAIYFVSDGQPTDGKIVEPAEILAALRRINHTRRVAIYVIGIAPGEAGNPFDTFLKQIAEDSSALYRRVQQ